MQTGPDTIDGTNRFRDLVLPEVDVLLRVATRMTRNPVEAEDLVQEVLLRAHRGIEGFDGRHPRAWLLTIMRNTWASSHRKRRPLVTYDPEGMARTADPGPDPEAQLMARQLEGPILDALAALRPHHQQVVLLVDADGLTHAEAAELLGVPVGTVMSRLHRARARLRTRLERAGVDVRQRP